MALDATRGLPSFSEMYQAYKSKASLGGALQAGYNAYNAEQKSSADNAKNNAEAEKNKAEAAYYLRKNTDDKKVPLSSLPQDIQGKLIDYADAQGLVSVDVAKTAMGTSKLGAEQDAKAKELAQKEASLAETAKHNAEKNAIQEELNRTRQELGNNQQELTAAHTVADITAKGEEPSLLNRGVSMLREATGHTPTEDVLNERIKAAALQKLQQRGGIPSGGSAPAASVASPAPVNAAPQPRPAPGKQVVIDGTPQSEAAYNSLPKGATYVYQGKTYTKQ